MVAEMIHHFIEIEQVIILLIHKESMETKHSIGIIMVKNKLFVLTVSRSTCLDTKSSDDTQVLVRTHGQMIHNYKSLMTTGQ